MKNQCRGLLLAVLMVVPLMTSRPVFGQQGKSVPPKVANQLHDLMALYRSRDLNRFITLSSELLARAGRDGVGEINEWLKSQKLPSIEKLVANVRIEATKSNVALPAPSWNEFKWILPEVIAQIQSEIESFEHHPLNQQEVTTPEKFADYDKLLWQLHIFRNQFSVLNKVAKGTQTLKARFSRQIDKWKHSATPTEFAPFEFDLSEMASKFEKLLIAIDEREAEIRVLRIDDANDLIAQGGKFGDQFDAAFALAYDELFFSRFFETARKENRRFQNPDLNDDSIAEILSGLVESARTQNPSLFEKATLFYVGSHWWLRGRYGQGPLANGLLKTRQAAKTEKGLFPLFMPVAMPNVDQLIGQQNPRPVIRRHAFVWSLGNEGIESMSTGSRGGTPAIATLDRFY